MEEPQKNNASSHFAQGFFLGLVFGVGLTLLLVTKKGRKILRTLADEGWENFTELRKNMDAVRSDVSSQIEKAVDEEIVSDEEETPPSEKPEPAPSSPGKNGVKKSVRKLFKGIPKKSQ